MNKLFEVSEAWQSYEAKLPNIQVKIVILLFSSFSKIYVLNLIILILTKWGEEIQKWKMLGLSEIKTETDPQKLNIQKRYVK